MILVKVLLTKWLPMVTSEVHGLSSSRSGDTEENYRRGHNPPPPPPPPILDRVNDDKLQPNLYMQCDNYLYSTP